MQTCEEIHHLSNLVDVSGSGDNIKMRDVQTGKQISEQGLLDYMSQSLAFSPDGRTLVSGSFGGTIEIWRSQLVVE